MKSVVIKMTDVFKKILSSDEFREESFVAETQAKLAELLDERGYSRAELARKLNVSRARVTQIFSDDANNLTLRLLARSFLALGEEPVILTRQEYEDLKNQTRKKVDDRNLASRKDTALAAGLETWLIADLLRANKETNKAGQEKGFKKSGDISKWIDPAPNVYPLRRRANG